MHLLVISFHFISFYLPANIQLQSKRHNNMYNYIDNIKNCAKRHGCVDRGSIPSHLWTKETDDETEQQEQRTLAGSTKQ